MAVKSCPPAPPGRSGSFRNRFRSRAPYLGLQDQLNSRLLLARDSRRACRPSRLVGVLPVAAEAMRRSRDKRRRRTRKQVKMSMWREIQPQDLGCYAMWACCDDTSSVVRSRPPHACAAGGAHGGGRAEGHPGLQVCFGRVHRHPAGPLRRRPRIRDQRPRVCGLELCPTGLSLQHGWTCTPFGSIILRTGTSVKACARSDPSPRLRCQC